VVKRIAAGGFVSDEILAVLAFKSHTGHFFDQALQCHNSSADWTRELFNYGFGKSSSSDWKFFFSFWDWVLCG